MLCVMLALLWVPITSHCMFERLPGLEFLACVPHVDASSTPQKQHCADEACAVIEEGSYKIQDDGDLVPKPVLTIAFLLGVVTGEATVKDSGGEPLRAAHPPPHLAPAWQFADRAAVPVRAPSLA